MLGATDRVSFIHGLTVRCVNVGYVTIRMSVAGGAVADLGKWLSSVGTGMRGVTVSVLFSLTGSHMSCFSAAHAMVRGFSAAWPFLWEAGAFGGCFDLFQRVGRCGRLCVCVSVVPILVLAAAAILGGVQVRGSLVAAVRGGVKVRGLHLAFH